MSCGSDFVNTRPRRNNNFVNDSGLKTRKKELIQGARPHEPEILDAPSKPEDPMEIERHEVTHIPPMPWCLACRLGKGRDASHFRAVREAAQIQIDI